MQVGTLKCQRYPQCTSLSIWMTTFVTQFSTKYKLTLPSTISALLSAPGPAFLQAPGPARERESTLPKATHRKQSTTASTAHSMTCWERDERALSTTSERSILRPTLSSCHLAIFVPGPASQSTWVAKCSHLLPLFPISIEDKIASDVLSLAPPYPEMFFDTSNLLLFAFL